MFGDLHYANLDEERTFDKSFTPVTFSVRKPERILVKVKFSLINEKEIVK